jgi:hypothetical protein
MSLFSSHRDLLRSKAVGVSVTSWKKKGITPMTDKTDKAAAAKVEDKQDAAYKKYETEQATHEKTHPGEIDEPAYAKYEAAYDKAEGKPVGMMSADRTEVQKKYDAAHAEAVKLSQAAAEAHEKADKKVKTPEQVAAEEADKKADDARAKAAELHPDKHAPATPAKPVKRGNDPVDPAYAPGIPTHDEAQTVRLVRTSPDSPMPVYTMVHPEMVGDYLRAGWSRA